MKLPLHDRRSVPELMDAPNLDHAAHHAALAGLHRLNRASRAADIIVRPILAFARRNNLSRLSLLDVACGGGDVPLRIATLARDAGITLDLTLTDRSPTALETAQTAARAANVSIAAVQGEAPHSLPTGPFDIVTNSLFLHHLPASAVIETLAGMKSRASKLLVISDLRRSTMGYAIAWSAARILSRSPIVHYDGPASVQAAWTIPEMQQFATQANMPVAIIIPIFPWRMLLTWSPAAGSAQISVKSETRR
jgi:2-polyprenyl-3-methyl-5-hydroxy-6-metoxy-1,4-benzoquinol methylase